MITEEKFLESELGWGIGFHNPEFVGLCGSTIEQIRQLPIKTVLDFGAGTGVYADAALKAGFDTYVYEIWEAHRNYIRQNSPGLKFVDEPITTDAMLFIEVAEHMTDEELHTLLDKISPKYILFSSTSEVTDWDEEWGHINVKPQVMWVELFAQYGYGYRNLSVPTPWAKLFTKNE